MQKVRPSIRDLQNDDFDSFAFPDLENDRDQAPAARVKRVNAAAYDISGVSSSRNASVRVPVAERDLGEANDETTTTTASKKALKPLVKDILEHDDDEDELIQPPALSRASMSSFPVPPKLSFSSLKSSTATTAAPSRSALANEDGKAKQRQDIDKLMQDVSLENERLLGQMSPDEIAKERDSIAQLGLSEGVLNMLKKRAQSKQKPSPHRKADSKPPEPESHHHHHHHHHSMDDGPTFDNQGDLRTDGEGHSLSSLLAFTASSLSSQRAMGFLVLAKVFATQTRPDNVSTNAWLKARSDATKVALTRGLIDPSASVSAQAAHLLAAVASQETSLLAENESVEAITVALSRRDIQDATDLLVVIEHLPLKIEVVSANLVRAAVQRFVHVNWPQQAYPRALVWFNRFASAARINASTLAAQDLLEPFSRFLSLPYWQLPSDSRRRVRPCYDATLELLGTLAEYGLGTSMRTTCASLLMQLETHLPAYEQGQEATVIAWLKLATLWTAAAVDPHLTDHSLTWTKLSDWFDTVLEIYERAKEFDSLETNNVIAAVYSYLAAYVNGARINEPNKGQDALDATSQAVRQDLNHPATRIDEAIKFEQFNLPQAAAHLANALVLRPAEDLAWPLAAWYDRAASLSNPDRFAERFMIEVFAQIHEGKKRFEAACHVVSVLKSGEEVAASRWVDALLAHCDLSEDVVMQNASKWLRPFVVHAIVQSVKGRTANAVHPVGRELKTVAYVIESEQQRKPILRTYWALGSVIDELLRSADSIVFKTKLPDGWNASELELVQTALAVTAEIATRGAVPVRPAELVYECMKIFMLEKDSPATSAAGSTSEVFRDELVQSAMRRLLDPCRLRAAPARQVVAWPAQHDSEESPAPLEKVSAAVSTAPFFQLYSDFVGLYDSISFGDPLFAALLLPPLALQSYPAVDYRRLIWNDYAHVLKTVSLSVQDILTDSTAQLGGSSSAGTTLSTYLFPIESNSSVLEWYARAMAASRIRPDSNEFLFFVAVHHVSSFLFYARPASERSEDEGEPFDQSTAADSATRQRLARILSRDTTEATRALELVVAYDQNYENGQALVLPPACWTSRAADDEHANERRAKLASLLKV